MSGEKEGEMQSSKPKKSYEFDDLLAMVGGFGRYTRVVTRYLGSVITVQGSGITSRGIRISSTVRGPGSSSFLGYNNQDHKILKYALIGGTCQRFKIQL